MTFTRSNNLPLWEEFAEPLKELLHLVDYVEGGSQELAFLCDRFSELSHEIQEAKSFETRGKILFFFLEETFVRAAINKWIRSNQIGRVAPYEISAHILTSFSAKKFFNNELKQRDIVGRLVFLIGIKSSNIVLYTAEGLQLLSQNIILEELHNEILSPLCFLHQCLNLGGPYNKQDWNSIFENIWAILTSRPFKWEAPSKKPRQDKWRKDFAALSITTLSQVLECELKSMSPARPNEALGVYDE